MKYILPVNCNADFMEIDAAVVDVDEELLTTIKARRQIFNLAHGDAPDLYSMRYWCGAPDFFDTVHADDDVCEGLETGETIEAAEDFAPSELSRVEVVTMIVSDSGVHWIAFPKHCDEELRTEELRWDELFPATPEN